MPPKAKLQAPIDRPLSRAYLREFSGWSTAYPPGVSEPTSQRILENMMVNRDGTLRLRPALKYLSFETPPPANAESAAEGVAYPLPFVGTHEPFYLNDGSKAYLCAVREVGGTVGFRVLAFTEEASAVYALDDPVIGFTVPQGDSVLNFSEGTTYVKYLQIDNKIFALSDNGEPMRMFFVGAEKEAKVLASIVVPGWRNDHKLSVMHPEAVWINGRTPTDTITNYLPNPSFEKDLSGWHADAVTKIVRSAPTVPAPVKGSYCMRLESLPTRTNLVPSPLHNVAALGIAGWYSSVTGSPTLLASSSWLEILPNGAGTFYARTDRIEGIVAGQRYQLAFDISSSGIGQRKARMIFYGSSGQQVGETQSFDVPDAIARYASITAIAPANATSVVVSLGGIESGSGVHYVRVKNVVLCKAEESSTMFSGSSGANYFWTGAVNDSASVYHPPQTIAIACDKVPAAPATPATATVYVAPGSTQRSVTMILREYDKDGSLLGSETSAAVLEDAGAFKRYLAADASTPANTSQIDFRIQIPSVARGEYHYVDAAMMTRRSFNYDYFDGDSPKETLAEYKWTGASHASTSEKAVYATYEGLPTAETPTANTLVSTGTNGFSFAFFYTFSNEIGESAASKITVKRAARAWSEWAWKTPNAAGEPSATETETAEKAADQLVALIPENVFDEALSQGAVGWSLYMFTWSDQDAVPVVGLKVAHRELTPASVWEDEGWLRVVPGMGDITEDAVLPTEGNRSNFSTPPRAGQGLVAADRMILVNDPTSAAVIRWSSNRMGQYTNLTARVGGGFKTLVSGNLFVPAAVKLWQNPQSADTLTILCLGTDGMSASYYMAPASITSQTDTTQIMGFEETTATPGTTSPYGVEVSNNALYHPIDEGLMKSTASNYNINHKMMTEQILDQWAQLETKYWIISSQLDNRLYYLVNNPNGETILDGCKGNELWVFDSAAESGSWSRMLVQGSSLRKIEYGGKVYMSIVRPDGVFYLDPDSHIDDVVVDGEIALAPIPFRFETNTQGANRAHDAWCYLQQASLVLGNFRGAVRWGLRGMDVNGKMISTSKVTRNKRAYDDAESLLPWDQEDHLRVARNLKEWFFFAESLDDEEFAGQFNLVQYRYTPVSVNVGYDYGSVETFEYTRDVALAASTTTENGVPVPFVDTRRP